MNILYIAPYSEGSTSKMRGQYLRQILKADQFKVIDTQIPINHTNKIFRSIGWRYKTGPLIKNVNQYIFNALQGQFSYDLVWVDKGVFIQPSTIQLLKKHSAKLVHFTPDPAFTYHRSKLFNAAVPLYDYCVTTKSYEVEYYQSHGANPIVCSQGYDPLIHKPYHSFNEKEGIVFIGHKEEEREEILSMLLEKGIRITLAGINWESFANRHKSKSNLIYKGKGIFGTDYGKEISKAKLGLGLLSKWVPEFHTTRTFEIPACGTALVTERTNEIAQWFNNDEVIFFDDAKDIVEKVCYALNSDSYLHQISTRGYTKVTNGKYDYRGILEEIITRIYQ